MVLHKNKWDRKATKAHERKLRAKAEASGTAGTGTGTGGMTATASGGAKASASRKPVGVGVGVGPKSTDPAVAGDKDDDKVGEEEGGVRLVGEGGRREEGDDDDDDDDEEEEEEENEKRGKYSRRKIVNNSWRYEEPEEDPYLKAQEEEDQEPEPDYARMTIGKAQLKDSSDEEHEEDADNDPDDRRALDEILIRDKPTSQGLPAKGKIIQVDRRHFQGIDEKIAKQKAADAFRQRFVLKPQAKAKAPPPGSHTAIDFGDDNDNGTGDIDEFLGQLKLEAQTPAAQGNLEKTRMTIASGPSKGLRSEEEDDRWLDEMLGSSGLRAAVVAKGQNLR